MQHKIFSCFVAILFCFSVTSCGADGETTIFTNSEKRAKVSSEELQFTTPEEGDTIAVFTTDLGDISVVLYTSLAPQACENFITLANEGFFDGSTIDRIVSDFCVQAGLDAEGNSTTIWDGSTYPTEITDQLHHYAGALCTATDQDGTASSPFYWVSAMPASVSDEMVSAMEAAGVRQEVIDTYLAAGGVPYLDYTDTVFGQIYEGFDVLDAIDALETDENAAPLEPVTIQSVTITTY